LQLHAFCLHRGYTDGMPVTITVRAVPDEVRDVLAARAALAGKSLQEYLSAELETLASRPSVLEAVMRARARARTYPPVGPADLMADLDADRR
jgi:antitoxin FitA